MQNVLARPSTASFFAGHVIDQCPASDSDLLTVTEAAIAAKVDPKTIRRLIKSNRLKAAPYGSGTIRKNYRIRRGDLALVADNAPADASHDITPQPRRRRLNASSAADFLPRVA